MRNMQTLEAGRMNARQNISCNEDIFIVVQNERDAEMLKTDLATIIEDVDISILPGWGTLPYRPASPGNKVFGQRADFLCRLLLTQSPARGKRSPHIFIAVQRVLLTPVTPPDFLRPFIFSLEKGQQIDTQEVSAALIKSCYVRVPKVSARGEFSLRGEVLDIFLPAGEDAVRIVFDFDKIEEIKTFDIETQTTTGSTDCVLIGPMKEVLWNKELVSVLEKDGVLWKTEAGDEELFAENTVDFLGVNFYHPNRVKRPDISPDSVGDWLPSRYYDNYDMPGRRMNIDKGWEIYPKALYDIAVNVRDNYRNIPWFVSENGMGVSREERFMGENGQIQDDYRINFIKEHLEWLHKGIQEGSNCFGYHLWTPIDCWSWTNAYRNRYGLISNDIHTQVKTIKKSGYWLKGVIEKNAID